MNCNYQIILFDRKTGLSNVVFAMSTISSYFDKLNKRYKNDFFIIIVEVNSREMNEKQVKGSLLINISIKKENLKDKIISAIDKLLSNVQKFYNIEIKGEICL